jgi:hypothetical protein
MDFLRSHHICISKPFDSMAPSGLKSRSKTLAFPLLGITGFLVWLSFSIHSNSQNLTPESHAQQLCPQHRPEVGRPGVLIDIGRKFASPGQRVPVGNSHSYCFPTAHLWHINLSQFVGSRISFVDGRLYTPWSVIALFRVKSPQTTTWIVSG